MRKKRKKEQVWIYSWKMVMEINSYNRAYPNNSGTCAGNYSYGTLPKMTTSFGLDDLCTTEQCVSALRLWGVFHFRDWQWGLHYWYALT